MRALSLTQPWATLVANGSKKVETRSWRTSYLGEIAIHAAKGFPKWAKDDCMTPVFARALWPDPPGVTADFEGCRAEQRLISELPLGAVVAVAQLAHVMPTEHRLSGSGARVFERPAPGTPEHAFGDYSPRRFMWFLENVRPLRGPVPCRGALGVWVVPRDVAASVREQLKRTA